jgi:hypothetical protein
MHRKKKCFFNLQIAIIFEAFRELTLACNTTKLLDLSLSSELRKFQLNSLYRQLLLCTF